MKFYETTRELLLSSGIHYDVIAAEVGVSSRWLYKVKKDKVKRPDLICVEKLRNYLEAQKKRNPAS